MDSTDRTRARAYALLKAYGLARTLPEVVRSREAGTYEEPLWAFDFEDEDDTVVIADVTGPVLLSKKVGWASAVEHAKAGHRTNAEGLGDASTCTVCAAATSPGVLAKAFTHPDYVEPQPEEPEQAAA